MSLASKATGLMRRWLGSDSEHESSASLRALEKLLRENPSLAFDERTSGAVDERTAIFEARYGMVATAQLPFLFDHQLRLLGIIGQLFGGNITPEDLVQVVTDLRMNSGRIVAQGRELEALRAEVGRLRGTSKRVKKALDGVSERTMTGRATKVTAAEFGKDLARSLGEGVANSVLDGVFGNGRTRK